MVCQHLFDDMTIAVGDVACRCVMALKTIIWSVHYEPKYCTICFLLKHGVPLINSECFYSFFVFASLCAYALKVRFNIKYEYVGNFCQLNIA